MVVSIFLFIFEYQIKTDMRKFFKKVILYGDKDYRDISIYFTIVIVLALALLIYVLS